MSLMSILEYIKDLFAGGFLFIVIIILGAGLFLAAGFILQFIWKIMKSCWMKINYIIWKTKWVQKKIKKIEQELGEGED